MKSLTSEQVLKLYQKMVAATGGEYGIRDMALLDSALNNAFSTFDGEDLYKSIEDKCANVCLCIIKNHPFIDGNKRMGIYVLLIMLELNGLKLRYT